MIKVKVSARGAAANANLSQFVGNQHNAWGDCVFSVNAYEKEADVWIVSEDVDDDDTSCLVPADRMVFVSAETSWPPNFYSPGTSRSDFLENFARIYTCHDVFDDRVVSCPPFLPWMINSNHGTILDPHYRDLSFFLELDHLPKTREISVFCSTQVLTESHRMRLRFVEALKSHFGDRLDWFGTGINPVDEKWEGIAPYRYTIVLENRSASNVFTEKIMDAYLGLSYPVYWGAPNLDDFFPTTSFTSVNVRDLRGSIDIIESLVAGNQREERMQSLIEAKRRVLTDHNVFNRFALIATDVMSCTPHSRPELISLSSWSAAERHRGRSLRSRISSRLSRLTEEFVADS